MGITLKNTLRFILKLTGALLLGAVITAFVMQHNPTTWAVIERELHAGFGKAFDCVSSGRVTGINLLWPTIEMESVVVKPREGSPAWHWSSRKAVITFSWLGAVLRRCAPLHITLTDVHAHSVADETGKPAIADHLKKLSTPVKDGLPVVAQELILNNVSAQIHHHDTSSTLHLRGNATMRKKNQHALWDISATDGVLSRQEVPLVEQISGSLHVDTAPQFLVLNTSLHCSLACLSQIPEAQRRCTIQGSWNNGRGSGTLQTADRLLTVGPVTVTNHQFSGQLTAPLSYLHQMVAASHNLPLSGICTVHASGDTRNIAGSLRTDISVREGTWAGVQLPALQFTLSADHGSSLSSLLSKPSDKKMTGIVDLQVAPGFVLTGSWSWHPREGTSVTALTMSPISLPLEYWHIRPEDMRLKASLTPAGGLTATYEGTITHEKLGTQHKVEGTVTYTGRGIALQGACNEHPITVAWDQGLHMNQAAAHHKAGGCVLDITATGSSSWDARVDYSLIRSLLPSVWQPEYTGQGELHITAQRLPEGGIDAHVTLHNGAIRMPVVNNFLNQLQGTVRISGSDQSATLQNMTLGFHRGKISIPQAKVYMDGGRIRGLHLPLFIEDLFASWQQDVGGMVSGGLLLSKQGDAPLTLQGNLFAQSSYMRSLDIFKPRPGASGIACIPLNLDLRILTRDPLVITSPLLDAKVTIDSTTRHTAQNPEITGLVKFVSGTLKFPYKPMHIMSGSLTFVPGQDDPTIELLAKNKIRKYNVTLQVNGTVANPQIIVDSSPPLTQEQIVALLLTGAEEGSLSVMMPTLVIQNLQQSLFNSRASKSSLNNYFKSLLKPLSRVRLVPRFTEETGRGGLRGAIEIEVSDDLQATIEKNFSLTEDIAIKVDYSLSDEVSLRGIQDERGDLGSEMEVRWRF